MEPFHQLAAQPVYQAVSSAYKTKKYTRHPIHLLFPYFASSKAATQAPGRYPLRPRYSLANTKSEVDTLPLSILVH